ncbi:MAG: RDD family protein [Flavobacteriaceae bacterium]|jgi:uncharacterized RDD family membrane protein YckC|nr:RDD family protein [Flavobacteriaceae bacterium]
MANLTINTTQNIKIEFKRASLGERILASMLDFLFVMMYAIMMAFALFEASFMKNNTLDRWSEGAIWIVIMLPAIFYSFACESIFHGVTIGKKIMRIKVIKIDGYEASIVDYFARWAMRIIDISSCTGVIGILSVAFSEKGQRLGDIVAGTAVISVKERIPLSATIFEEVSVDYVPLFPQVVVLSDRDIQIIKDALNNAKRNKDFKLLVHLCKKVESVLKVNRQEYSELGFIEAVLQDYNYLTARF